MTDPHHAETASGLLPKPSKPVRMLRACREAVHNTLTPVAGPELLAQNPTLALDIADEVLTAYFKVEEEG